MAAVELGWDYLHTKNLELQPEPRQAPQSKDATQQYMKAVYWEYTDSTFSTPKPKAPWTGILGPTIRAEVNDKVVVHFKNFASQPYSVHPVGISYWKQSEGAGYDDATSSQEKEDDAVAPGGSYRYVWDIQPASGPTLTDPECLTYSYSSQVDIIRDLNSGLIGALLICKAGALGNDGHQKVPVYILLFAVFDEARSWYGESRMARENLQKSRVKKVFHTINGYVNSTLPGLKLCQKTSVFWHLIGMGSSSEIHSIRFQDHTLQVHNHRKVLVEVTPMSFATAEMKPVAPGKFLISCQIHSHQIAGMNAHFTVDNCPEPAEMRDKKNAIHTDDYEYDITLEGLVSTMVMNSGPNVRSSVKLKPKVWEHYIAAEEVVWDYAPELSGSESTSDYVVRGPQRIGKVYKKAAYVEYTDKTFRVRKTTEKSLMGPVLRGEVEDKLKIVFKNLASVPFNIYPTGLTFSRNHTSNFGKDLKNNGVIPNETAVYMWTITAEDGPTKADPRCLTRLYQSTVNPERDLASGLVGHLIVCYRKTLDKRGNVLMSDRERHLTFAVFDENKSWYIEENIQKYTKDPSKVDPNDPSFYKSNVMYSKYVYIVLNTLLKYVTLWHVLNVGTQSNFLSVYFMGNTFERDKMYETVLTLFPMSGETVSMEMETAGMVNLAETLYFAFRGMSARYTVQHCERNALVDEEDYYDYLENNIVRSSGSRRNRTLAVKLCKRPKKNNVVNSVGNATVVGPEKPVCVVKYITLTKDDKEEDFSDNDIPEEVLLELEKENVPKLPQCYEIRQAILKKTMQKTFQGHILRYSCDSVDREMRKGMRKYLPKYKKVVFRAYLDQDFKYPASRGELEEHLGIMGPVIKAEINDFLTVTFKNLASRPFSFHLHGVFDRSQGQEFGETLGEAVQPQEVRVYNWKITKRQGPSPRDFNCKAWTYYSTLNMEKDINSGLIGPLIVCKPGTLNNLDLDIQEFYLLFNVFDETKSWYFDENIKEFCTPPCQFNKDDPWLEIGNKFAAINGYVAETLPGLLVPQHHLVHWHLLNMGGDGEFHAVHFHGLPFTVRSDQEHRMGVYRLYPGVFGTVEMRPAMVGTWMVECSIGDHQLSGMRAKLLVYSPSMYLSFIPVSVDPFLVFFFQGDWEARLARLELSGSINAWSGLNNISWIQVDLQRPMLVHEIRTQGASHRFSESFVLRFTLSYSLDNLVWKTYKGNSTISEKMFSGNTDGSRIKSNFISPPMLGRYIRVNPIAYRIRPTLRMELYGCDLNSCSMPMGMEKMVIPNHSISASSFFQKLFLSWSPSLARLNFEGSANAWRPKTNNPYEWIQVDFKEVKRITGVITQGARSFLTHMMVTEFTVSFSNNGHVWSSLQDESVFHGNNKYDEEVLNIFEPPLFTRYIRIHPKGWYNDIALRLEFLGCDTQQ
uniref:Coagulation factor VIII-like n=1 Tax=Scleropages formosus TaxID=113540 RepID=A0A8C9TFT3_SCLFO